MATLEKSSGCVGLHPATRIFLWVCLALAVPQLYAAVLHMTAVVCMVVALFSPLARRFLWRTRFLFLALALILPWTTPGVYAVAALGIMSPTHEGLLLAVGQLERSCIVLVSLSLALSGLDTAARLRALLGFLQPLARTGLPVERLAVRLVLTLQRVEQEPSRRRWQEWQAAWNDALTVELAPTVLDIEVGQWQLQDYLSIVLAVVALGGVVLCVGP